MTETTPHYLDWNYIEAAADNLANQIKDRGWKPRVIVGIARGGLVPATLLSHRLNVRLLRAIQCIKYDNQRNGDHPVVVLGSVRPRRWWSADDTPSRNEDCLFVDDVIHSGETISECMKIWPKANYCSLYMKMDAQQSSKLPDHVIWAQAFPKDKWLVFPWEHEA